MCQKRAQISGEDSTFKFFRELCGTQVVTKEYIQYILRIYTVYTKEYVQQST